MIVGFAGSYAMDFYILPVFEYNVGEMGKAWVVIGAREDEYTKQYAIVAHIDCDFGDSGFFCSRLAGRQVGSRGRCACSLPVAPGARLLLQARRPPGWQRGLRTEDLPAAPGKRDQPRRP